MSISDFTETTEPKEQTQWSDPNAQASVPTTTTTENVPAPGGVTNTPTVTSESTPQQDNPTNAILQGIMSKIGPVGTHSHLKLMIFGDPGSTKSSIGASASDNLIVDAEDGVMAAKQSPWGIADNVQTYPWQGFDDFRNLVWTLAQNPPELNWIKRITIDTLSEVHKQGLQEIMMREKARRPSINEFVPETEHHTENNERIIRLVRALRNLDRDLIIITHARTVEPKGKAAKTYADFSESLSNKIMAMMDVVGHMSWKIIDNQAVPVMRLISDGQVHAKNRIGLPEEIINPNFDMIKQAWEASKNK